MKAFKGCTNPDCTAYKKIHYKDDDQFCLKCGAPISYVCAKCWKPMEDNSEKYCISCKALKEQNRAQIIENAKTAGGVVLSVAGVAVSVVSQVGNDSEKLSKGVKKIVKAGAEISKTIKK